MKIILTLLITVTAMICFATEPEINIKDVSTLGKYLAEYNELFKENRKYHLLNKENPHFDKCINLEDALTKYFNTHPQDFEKLYNKKPDIFKFKPFCFIADQKTKISDKVYCKIIRKIIIRDHIKPLDIVGWALQFAESTYSLQLLKDYKQVIMNDSSINKIWKKNFLFKLKRNQMVVDLYKELSEATPEKTKTWEAYFVPIKRIRPELKKHVMEMEEALTAKYYPNGIDYDQIEKEGEKGDAKLEELNEKILELHDSLPSFELYCDDDDISKKAIIKSVINNVEMMAKIERVKININYSKLFHILCEYGGKIEDTLPGISYPNVLIYNKQKQLIYIFDLLIPTENDSYKGRFYELIKFYYDKNGTPVDFIFVRFSLEGTEMNKAFNAMRPKGWKPYGGRHLKALGLPLKFPDK